MEYYKKVRLDNKKAMERKQVESHHSSKHKKETTVDDVADYFSGKDNDDFLRSEALNENIDESVRKVNEAEPAQFKKRKVKEKPTGKKKKGQKKAAEEDEEEDSYEVSL
ncbi:hypothetical protein AGDE_14144 [Angomonas deanei]|uniref:Uncharacterized protein n=1 Tax=Angomonas deanei TaxID=59799 RepID=A0A7G2C0F8_9TRYP|nr:hypothetical protein AGDE_14144 [Angomonas deanei]CAD2212681.1 hypothetical protein, conserved [Angomonas deanei]|eukprot:EPY21302.1 hypothetical protein AGDE_14144 [Angomonas deanei]